MAVIRKSTPRLIRSVVQIVDKSQEKYPKPFKLNSIVKLHHCLLAPSIAFGTTMGSMEGTPEGLHYCKKNIKRPDCNAC